MKPKTLQNEEWLKLGDDLANELRHTIEHFKDRLTSDNLRLSERYIQSQLKILVRMSLVGASGKSQYLIAAYQGFPRHNGELDVTASQTNVPIFHHANDCENEAMLIDAVQVVDIPKRLIPSRVRLYSFEDFVCSNAHLAYFSLADGRCVLLGTLANREVSVFAGFSTTRLDKLPSQMVERASEVVNCIANSESDAVWNRTDIINLQTYVRNLRIVLGSKSISLLGIAERTDGGVQILDVLFGPFNL